MQINQGALDQLRAMASVVEWGGDRRRIVQELEKSAKENMSFQSNGKAQQEVRPCSLLGRFLRSAVARRMHMASP